MCEESLGWSREEVAESLELMGPRNSRGNVTLMQFASWYTDDGLVRNVFSSFERRGNGKRMGFEDFSRLCVHTSSSELHADEIQDLFERFDCTKSAEAQQDDTTVHISGWLEAIGYSEYAGAFLQQGFDTLASVRSANVSEHDLRDIGVRKMRHRKDMLASISSEGYLGVAELTRLFMTVKANRLTLQELRCVKHGALDLYVGADAGAGAGAGGGGGAIAVGRGPFRDCDWQSVYATLWT
jgi:hypothetical protein|eukprot:SAG25_NODE_216_length_11681_cov_7.180021_10_plen_240_part_00